MVHREDPSPLDTEYNKQTGAGVAQWFTGRIRHSWTQSTINRQGWRSSVVHREDPSQLDTEYNKQTGAGEAQWFTGRIRHSWTQSTINRQGLAKLSGSQNLLMHSFRSVRVIEANGAFYCGHLFSVDTALQ